VIGDAFDSVRCCSLRPVSTIPFAERLFMTIHIISAPAGSAQTRELARYSPGLARLSQTVLFLQSTTRLIDKAVADELQAMLSVACLSAACGGDLLPVRVEAGTT
jgi:hypothetical protein